MTKPLGQEAVDAGIKVFVGHAAAVSPPDSGLADRPEYDKIQNCFLAMVQTFLDGCDDEGIIRTSGWDACDALEAGIGLDEESDTQFWGIVPLIGGLVKSLRVLKRPTP